MSKQLILAAFLASAAFAAAAHASVTYDFKGQGGTFDGQTSVGVVLNDPDTGQSATMTVVGFNGNLNSNAGGMGVGDALISNAELITLKFDKPVILENIDLGSVGAQSGGDSARLIVGFANQLDVVLFTGAPFFNGTTDVFTFTPQYNLPVGPAELVQVRGEESGANVELEGITLTIVPEPASLALLGLGGLAVARRRK